MKGPKCTVLAALALCGAAGFTLSAQDDDVGPTTKVTVSMLAAHIRTLAGHRVEVLGANVSRILSPRVFILEPATASFFDRDHRVAVLLEEGAAITPPGEAVVVTGTALTFLGANLTTNLPPAMALSDDERGAVHNLAIVVASEVTTPGGIDLRQAR